MQTGYALLESLAATPLALLLFFVFALILIFVMVVWLGAVCARYLRRNEQRSYLLFDRAAIGMGKLDSQGRVVRVNDRVCEILGYTRHELLGASLRDLTAPEDRAHSDELHALLREGTIDHFENEERCIKRDGTMLWVHVTVWTLRDGAGFWGAVVAIHDISERKHTEELLHQSEERFRVLAENIPQMIWVADEHANFFYLSPKWFEYTGSSEQQSINLGWTGALHVEDRAEALEQWNRAVDSRGSYEVEYRIRRHDGEYRWHLARAVPMLNSSTNQNLWFGTLTDVEDRKRAHTALVRSEKLASVGRMAATVAHEINNPLEAIMNSVYLALQDGSLSPDSLQRLKTAEEELVRVAHMTRQTLGFYRENSVPAPVEATSLVRAVVEMYVPKLIQRNIALSMENGHNLTIHAVAGEIRQVVSNILVNAIDASRPGGRLRIRTCSVPLNGTRSVRITLADTGEGIRPEHLERIFEPFFTTKESIGTGLGLWVSSEIVKRHNGSLRVRSQRGKGTVFSILLPQKEQHTADQPSQNAVHKGSLTVPAS